MTRYRFWILVAGLLLACAAPRRAALDGVTPHQVLSRVRSHARLLDSFEGWGDITVVVPGRAFRGAIHLIFRRPDSLWVKIEGPFGIDVLHGAFRGDSTILYYPNENMVYRGILRDVLDQDLLPVELSSTETILRFVGLFVPEEDFEPSIQDRIEDDLRLCSEKDGTLLIDPEGPVVENYSWTDEALGVRLSWEGSRFKRIGKVRLPQLIRMADYALGQRINLFYERIRINRPLKKGWCDVTIPEGVDILEY